MVLCERISWHLARGRWAGAQRGRALNSRPITPDRRRAQPHLPPVLAARYLLQPIGIAHITLPGAAVLTRSLDEVEVALDPLLADAD